MTARLAEVLRPYAGMLHGATFIGRHETQADDGDDGSRWYPDPGRPGVRHQSVTWTISSTENAPWVLPWAGTVAAETVRDSWSLLGALMRAEDGGPNVMVKWLKEEARRQRELAAAVGTWLHDVLEALLVGGAIPAPPAWMLGRTLRTGGERILITQETLDSWADGLLAFITDFRLEPIMSEASIANPMEGYATRTDVVAYLPGYGIACIDLKSGNVRRSVRAQLAAMLRTTEVWVPGGGKIPMPDCDYAAVLHLRPKFTRGYKLQRLLPDEVEAGWKEFRAAVRLVKQREAAGALDQAVMYPPVFDERGDVVSVPTLPMVEDLGIRASRAIAAAGLEWLADVAAFTEAELLAVRGVGPKAIDDIRTVLAGHGLALAGDLREVA